MAVDDRGRQIEPDGGTAGERARRGLQCRSGRSSARAGDDALKSGAPREAVRREPAGAGVGAGGGADQRRSGVAAVPARATPRATSPKALTRMLVNGG